MDYGTEPGPIENVQNKFNGWLTNLENDDIIWNVPDGEWGRTNKRVILFVHGYNNDEDSARIWNRCVFKRLYWQGYKGNLLGIIWRGDKLGPGWFNHNVYNAFETGYALGTQLPNIKQACGDRKIILFTQSLGAVVASEAVNNNDSNLIYKFIMSEAAIGRRAYLPGPIEPGTENEQLLEVAQEYGYTTDTEAPYHFDVVWQNLWSQYPYLHSDGIAPWWPDNTDLEWDPQNHTASQPNGSEPDEAVVDFQVRWRDIYNKDENGIPRDCYDPQGYGTPWCGIFKEVPYKIECRLYCSHSHNDAVLGPDEWEGEEVRDEGLWGQINAWMTNQIGTSVIGGKPDDSMDDNDDDNFDLDGNGREDIADCFDEDLFRQLDYTVASPIITRKSREWAALSFYFCNLQLAAGFVGIGEHPQGKYTSIDNEERGIIDHSSMRAHPYWDIDTDTSTSPIGTWDFWYWLYVNMEIE